MTAFLFVTDLDNTLVGDDTALAKLNQQLSQHRQEYGTKIVYATGRSLFLYRELATQKSLLTPDALITSVGTEIYLNPNQDTFDLEWAEIISQEWNREQTIATASHFADLILQDQSEQRPFKASYHLTEQASVEVIPQLKSALQQRGLNVKLIYSGGFDLDILPIKSDKGLAVQFLRQKWGIAPQKTVVCGDSGNDISMFSIGEEMGILVGNAQPELWRWYEANKTDYLYLAQARYADGILEGLYYFGFFYH